MASREWRSDGVKLVVPVAYTAQFQYSRNDEYPASLWQTVKEMDGTELLRKIFNLALSSISSGPMR